MTSELLERYRFDEALFERLRRRVVARELSSEANRLSATVEPPRAGDLVRLPGRGEAEFDAAFEEGFAAYARGEVAVAVLNGGMATRFGGVVKGVVEAVDGASFLELKARETEHAAHATGGGVPPPRSGAPVASRDGGDGGRHIGPPSVSPSDPRGTGRWSMSWHW